MAIRRVGHAVLLAAVAAPSFAEAEVSLAAAAAPLLDVGQVVLMSALVGAFVFVIISTVQLVRARGRSEAENTRLRLEVGDLKSFADRAEALVNEEDQRLVAWGAPGDPPLVAGSLPRSAGAPLDRNEFLNFEEWLQPESTLRLMQLLVLLREKGEHFQQVVTTRGNRLIEVRGRTVGGSAVARFRDLTGERLARAEIEARHDLLAAEMETMRAMLASAPMPIWLRDTKGALIWTNAAYAAAVEAKDNDEAVAHNLELLDTNSRAAIVAAHADGPVFTKRLSAIVAGARRIFDVADIVSQGGSAGIAVDVTEVEAAQAALRREIDFNARTLDRLQTAVAVFGPDRRLKSYNAAYRALFELDPGFLESAPDESAILDRLRAARKLPEQADFRSWRADLFAAYRSTEAREQWWHMPDGQTLRVIASPHPQGGATWVYENVTERLDLESRYNALVSVQGETLDHLAEGVGVFGSDGRLRLHNPAFEAVWRLDAGFLAARPHVTDIVSAVRKPGDDEAMWRRFTACVAGLDETRASISGRMERPDGRVIDYATVPLPDGQTMVTFLDVTDSVQVERALVERNEALEASDSLKNAFIHHVSYELRSPLTNIIGFAQLLSDVRVGPLNNKQREYTGYIMSSSSSLLAIVNDILDLTTIDAGIMGLDLAEVDVASTVVAAIDDVQQRLDENRIKLETRIAPDVGGLVADAKRVRQILFNLLANAVSFSTEGGHVILTADRVGGVIEFTVSDEGAGIPAAFIDSVFDRFASLTRGQARGGVGLGLSIVKSFVALHGGTVEIASEEGRGTVAKVRLPVRPVALDETVAA
ncbi:MAG: PAS-domain containing protein [Bauldia sp.]